MLFFNFSTIISRIIESSDSNFTTNVDLAQRENAE
ncbi:hypothetical protein ES703_17574 [subsurface metagenome]